MDIVVLGDKQNALLIWGSMKSHVKKMKNMHWNLYEKAAKAAGLMGDTKLAETFLQRLDQEKRKAEKMISSRMR
jgi:ferritin-like metal-binding protein YciE